MYIVFYFIQKLFQETSYQENLLLGQYDVCLSNIDIIYLLTGDKKKRLMIGHRFNDKVKGLHIICKVKETIFFFFKYIINNLFMKIEYANTII